MDNVENFHFPIFFLNNFIWDLSTPLAAGSFLRKMEKISFLVGVQKWKPGMWGGKDSFDHLKIFEIHPPNDHLQGFQKVKKRYYKLLLWVGRFERINLGMR